MVSLFISAVMLKVCVGYIRMEMAFGGTTFYGLPAWVGQMILPAGFALLCFRFLIKVLNEGIQLVRGLS
jgi:TRAP-type C4-dicarboxylate transport system permease small subunit